MCNIYLVYKFIMFKYYWDNNITDETTRLKTDLEQYFYETACIKRPGF